MDAEGDPSQGESDDDTEKMQVDQQSNYTQRNKFWKKKSAAGEQKKLLESNRRFWTEFMKKNLKYQTAPFGGNNPIYIPYETIE